MNAKALEPGRSYFIKHTSHQVRGVVRAINYRLDINTLDRVGAARLQLNEIGEISVETHHPLYFDAYTENRVTGAFIVIDPLSNETLGAGMIVDIEGHEEIRGQVSDADRIARFGHRGAVVAVEDTAAALLLERDLFDRGANVAVTAALDAGAAVLSHSAGLIAIVIGHVPAGAVDLRRMATHEAIRQLERRGVLIGREEMLTGGEGI
jgi:sulfate adenylyltransferase subunit 1 (EFTu-like GTPase family)